MSDFDLIGVAKVQDSVANTVTKFLQKVLIEMVICELALIRATERSFGGKGVGYS